MNKNDKKHPIHLVWFALSIAYLLAYVVLVIVKFSAPESVFAVNFFDKYVWIVKQTITEGAEVIEVSPSMQQIALNSLINILLILSVAKILRMLFRLRSKKSDRTKTVVSLLDGFVDMIAVHPLSSEFRQQGGMDVHDASVEMGYEIGRNH